MFKVFLIISLFPVFYCKRTGIRSLVKTDSWGNYTDGTVLYELNFQNKIEVVVPRECYSFGFCENIPNFPHEIIAELIDILIKDKVQFHKDNEIKDKANLSDADEETQELCDSRHVSFQPYAVRDNDTWVIVLNSKYKKVQSFNGEVCLGGPKKNCSSIAYFNTSYEGRCVQKYRMGSIIVLSPNLKQIIVKATPVPTCCSCVAFKKN